MLDYTNESYLRKKDLEREGNENDTAAEDSISREMCSGICDVRKKANEDVIREGYDKRCMDHRHLE